MNTPFGMAEWYEPSAGETKGRGKLGPFGEISVPIKDIWLYPLEKRFRVILIGLEN